MKPMINGIIVIDKEPGFTSFDVVAKMRGICGQKKIGHTGTLDPDATGVLPICLGKATRVSGILTDSDKEYEAILRLGIVTDTQDLSGQIQETHPVDCDEQQIKHVIQGFVGEIMQTPPMYSALKVRGKKLCDLAREGIEVERQSRPVTIYDIEILKFDLPEVHILVKCSKGTYIRTLCHDIGQILGCGGCLAKLRRTRAAGYELKEAHTLAQVQQAAEEGELLRYVQSIDSVFMQYREAKVLPIGESLARNGNPLASSMVVTRTSGLSDQEIVRMYLENGLFIGLFQFHSKEQRFRPYKMFLEE